jgi:hypothetical protein
MRCKKAKRLIDRQDTDLDPKLREHILGCPACARALGARRLMEKSFLSARSQKQDPATPFSVIQQKISNLAEAKKETENIMSKIRMRMAARPKMLTGLGLAVIAFLVVMLVPFPYTTTVGYQLSYSNLDNASQISADRLREALRVLGYGNSIVDISGDNCLISNLPDRQAAKAAAAAFAVVACNVANPDVKPITKTVSGSLLAQALNIFRIEVDTEGKSDSEIAEEIRQKLAADGFVDAQVSVTSEGDQREVTVNISQDKNGRELAKHLNLVLGRSDSIAFNSPKTLDDIEIDTENKTDAQIKAEMEARLAQAGILGAQVEVITTPEGKKEIKVTMEKTVERE